MSVPLGKTVTAVNHLHIVHLVHVVNVAFTSAKNIPINWANSNNLVLSQYEMISTNSLLVNTAYDFSLERAYLDWLMIKNDFLQS